MKLTDRLDVCTKKELYKLAQSLGLRFITKDKCGSVDIYFECNDEILSETLNNFKFENFHLEKNILFDIFVYIKRYIYSYDGVSGYARYILKLKAFLNAIHAAVDKEIYEEHNHYILDKVSNMYPDIYNKLVLKLAELSSTFYTYYAMNKKDKDDFSKDLNSLILACLEEANLTRTVFMLDHNYDGPWRKIPGVLNITPDPQTYQIHVWFEHIRVCNPKDRDMLYTEEETCDRFDIHWATFKDDLNKLLYNIIPVTSMNLSEYLSEYDEEDKKSLLNYIYEKHKFYYSNDKDSD